MLLLISLMVHCSKMISPWELLKSIWIWNFLLYFNRFWWFVFWHFKIGWLRKHTQCGFWRVAASKKLRRSVVRMQPCVMVSTRMCNSMRVLWHFLFKNSVIYAECGLALLRWKMHVHCLKRWHLEDGICCSKILMNFPAIVLPSQKCKLPLPYWAHSSKSMCPIMNQ